MTIDWSHFTPWSALAGGLLIGLASAFFLIFNGRIAGISGILGGLLHPVKSNVAWRVAFLLGLILAPVLYASVARVPVVEIDAGTAALLVAGLLVGIGTRYGSGCTSGHGVCGLARGSPRSMVATAAFMLAGFLTVYIVRHAIN